MTTDAWLNLPVADLDRSVAFYEAIGFKRHPGPGNTPSSASFLVGEKKIVLMLFTRQVFAGFVGGDMAEPGVGSAMLMSLGASTAAEVDHLAAQASVGGGTVYAKPSQAGGHMYGCGLCDPDGHRWNVLFMGGV